MGLTDVGRHIVSRPLTGARIETRFCRRWLASTGVAPSRGRGSKLEDRPDGAVLDMSPPHGGADRNLMVFALRPLIGCRPLTGARIETRTRMDQPPSWQARRRPLTGARIETCSSGQCGVQQASPPHGGADRNVQRRARPVDHAVAPSRGRGSKQNIGLVDVHPDRSPPHGGADRNAEGIVQAPFVPGRPLTGARIETVWSARLGAERQVAPSRGRGSKLVIPEGQSQIVASPPHGGADRNMTVSSERAWRGRRPLTGARIETLAWLEVSFRSSSPPHGGADRNTRQVDSVIGSGCRPLTGARIETTLMARCLPPPWRRPLTGARIETSPSETLYSLALSPPHGGADRNKLKRHEARAEAGRPLTGARIETQKDSHTAQKAGVAPSRGRGSKHVLSSSVCGASCRPLTGARIETGGHVAMAAHQRSPPHGGADRNMQLSGH